MASNPLSSRERDEIATCLSSDPEISWAELGRYLDRHRTTLSREVARNGGRYDYRACAAATRAERCAQRPRQPCPARKLRRPRSCGVFVFVYEAIAAAGS